MSGIYTVCGNYVTPALPREQWYNWRYAVEAVDEHGAPAMAGLQVMAEVSSSLEVNGATTHLMPTAAAFAAVHPDDVPWESDLCQAWLDMAPDNAAFERANFTGGELPSFTVCGTLEDHSCGSYLQSSYGPWSAYLAIREHFDHENRTFYLAAVHQGVIPSYPSLVFADATSRTAQMMAMTAREIWGVTR